VLRRTQRGTAVHGSLAIARVASRLRAELLASKAALGAHGGGRRSCGRLVRASVGGRRVESRHGHEDGDPASTVDGSPARPLGRGHSRRISRETCICERPNDLADLPLAQLVLEAQATTTGRAREQGQREPRGELVRPSSTPASAGSALPGPSAGSLSSSSRGDRASPGGAPSRWRALRRPARRSRRSARPARPASARAAAARSSRLTRCRAGR